MTLEAQSSETHHPELGQAAHMTTYNRLVRDRIPDIIEAMGNVVICQELDDESFSKALLEAMVRASHQFADHESLEALSDVLESIDAWLDVRGLTMEDVLRAKAEKRKRCGGFERRRYLQRVADGEEVDRLIPNATRC